MDGNKLINILIEHRNKETNTCKNKHTTNKQWVYNEQTNGFNIKRKSKTRTGDKHGVSEQINTINSNKMNQ